MDCDILIVGGGPGGFEAAKRAVHLGAKVILVEKGDLGGVCLNRGCIPTKTLLHSAQLVAAMQDAERFGIKDLSFQVDFAAIQRRKVEVVRKLRNAVEGTLKKKGVTYVRGTASLGANRTVVVKTDSNEETLAAKNIILATGSSPVQIMVPGGDSMLMSSDQALDSKELPKEVLIVGGGYIGLEFATLYSCLGAKVAVVEMLPNLLPNMDLEISQVVKRELLQRGIEIHTSAKITEISRRGKRRDAVLATQEGTKRIPVQKVLMAVGRQPNVQHLGLEKVGIAYDRNGVKVDESLRTSAAGVYAIGDMTGGFLLAHRAQAQGIFAVDRALGVDSQQDLSVVPGCLFTDPEVAAVGMSEEQARASKVDYKVQRLPFSSNSKCASIGNTIGLVKILFGKKHGEILGAHIAGPRATDLIAEVCLAMRMEATITELGTTIHPHPTFAESLMNAAQLADGII